MKVQLAETSGGLRQGWLTPNSREEEEEEEGINFLRQYNV